LPEALMTQEKKKLTRRGVRKPAKKAAPKSITREEAEQKLREDAEKITPEDVEVVLEKSDELEERFETGGPLGQFLGDFKLLLSVVKDYWKGRYRKIPYWSVAAIVATLLYVLNPFDLIPDFIPLVGQLDDVLVVTVCLAMIRQDMHQYKKWKLAEASKAEAAKPGEEEPEGR
jgi:uncharacterized membrane protein YkvA (DUF1232 family)